MSRRATRKTGLLAAAAALLLAACANQPTVYYSRVYYDQWKDFLAGGHGTEFLAVIWGNPFAADKAQTDAVVLDTAHTAFNRAGYRFTTTPKNKVNPLVPYLAVVFNADHVSSDLPCGDLSELGPPPAPSRNVTMQAAMCRRGTPLTRAVGSVANVSGPDDPRFRALAFQIATQVFQLVPRSGSGVTIADGSFR